jgi:hypothetical protein
MYQKSENKPKLPENFQMPFEASLAVDNRWVTMAKLIPWEEFEEQPEELTIELSAYINRMFDQS